jgi:hypothetical protein
MINEPLILPNQQEDNKGIGAFGFMPQPQPMPDLRQIAENIAKNQAINYIGKKVGIERLGTILGAQQAFGNPLGLAAFGPAGVGIGALQSANAAIQGSTFGRSGTIAEYLATKRQQKREEAMDKQQRRAQDYARTDARRAMTTDTAYTGGGDNNNDGGRSDPYGGGAGGLHSGY